jgi:hypothetical protein
MSTGQERAFALITQKCKPPEKNCSQKPTSNLSRAQSIVLESVLELVREVLNPNSVCLPQLPMALKA